jgi:hypothetical protein
MTLLSVRRLVAVVGIALLSIVSYAQPIGAGQFETNKAEKPYKLMTSGKQVTVKSTKSIKSVMVWTASGHRVVEQKDVNNSSYSFTLNSSEKIFFVMIQLEGSKPYTEKIGVQ